MRDFAKDPWTAPNAGRALLLTVDMQVDFSAPGAPAEISGTADAVPNVARLVRAFRAAKRPIIHLVRLYRANGDNVDLCRRAAVLRGWNVVRPGGTGAELVGEVVPPSTRLDASTLLDKRPQSIGESEWVVYKPRWGGFYQTCLEQMVGWLDVNTLVVCGCNFPNCPRATVYEASERDLRLVVVADAISGFYDRGREELQNIGAHVADTHECLDWIGAAAKLAGTSGGEKAPLPPGTGNR